MTPFIDTLLENSDDFTVRRDGATITFSPLDKSEDALEAFQETAEQLIANEGDGYEVSADPHRNFDYDVEYIDRIVVVLDD